MPPSSCRQELQEDEGRRDGERGGKGKGRSKEGHEFSHKRGSSGNRNTSKSLRRGGKIQDKTFQKRPSFLGWVMSFLLWEACKLPGRVFLDS